MTQKTVIPFERPGAIAPIAQASAYELVVEQIRRAISLGRFLPGQKLPPERELAVQLRVSRATVREAVRVLEGDGVLSIRRGVNGGLIVNQMHDVDGRSLRSLIRRQRQALDDIFDYRLAIECMTARLAAERRGDADLRRIEDALARMGEAASATGRTRKVEATSLFNAADTDFHIGIALATRNNHFVRAVEEIRMAMFMPVGAFFAELREDAHDTHAPICAAIAKGDGAEAARLMERHVEATRHAMLGFLEPRR